MRGKSNETDRETFWPVFIVDFKELFALIHVGHKLSSIWIDGAYASQHIMDTFQRARGFDEGILEVGRIEFVVVTQVLS